MRVSPGSFSVEPRLVTATTCALVATVSCTADGARKSGNLALAQAVYFQARPQSFTVTFVSAAPPGATRPHGTCKMMHRGDARWIKTGFSVKPSGEF